MKKELSKECKDCGVKWDSKFTNKYPKRAICFDCYKVQYSKLKQKYTEKRKDEIRKNEKGEPFTHKNRTKHWQQINKSIRSLKKYDKAFRCLSVVDADVNA